MLTRPSLPEEFTSASGRFAIHYTRVGANAAHDPGNNGPDPIIADGDPSGQALASTNPTKGAPSYIQRIAFWLDLALARYQAAGFPDPLTRFPSIDINVWKVIDDSGEEVRGLAGWGCIDLHNQMMTTDEPLLLARVQHTCCHELFHIVQDLLIFDSNGQQIVDFPDITSSCWLEGLPELAPDFVNGWQNAWMDHWAMMLPVTVEPLSDASYAACVLWRYVCDRFSNMSKTKDRWLFGADIAKEMLLLAQPGTTITWNVLFNWMEHHPEAHPQGILSPGLLAELTTPPLARLQPGLYSAMNWLRRWSDRCPAGADVYSDWLVANIVQDFGNASSRRCFGYADRGESPGLPRTQAVYVTPQTMPIGLTVQPWTWRYFALDMAQVAGPLHLDVKVAPLLGATGMKPNLQVVKTDGYRVIDIVRSNADLDMVIETAYSCPFPGFCTQVIRDVFIIFAAEEVGVQYSISFP